MISGKRLLFIKGKQKEFLLKVKKRLGMNQCEFSKFLGISRGGLQSWQSEECLLPSDIFLKVVNKIPELNDYKKSIKKIREKNWGVKKGGKTRIKQIKNIKKFMKEIRMKKVNKRTVKLPFPSNNYTFKILEKKINPNYLLATLLLTDGSLYGNNISYSSKDSTLINIVIDILRLCSKKLPSIYTSNGLKRVYLNDPDLVKNLLKLSPTFKTCPSSNQSVDDYCIESQPTIKFLNKIKKSTLIECIRLAISTDGGITLHQKRNKDTILIRPEIFLSCAHPTLCDEWEKVLEKIGIKMSRKRDKNLWSGIRGLSSGKLRYLIKLSELGGFIEDVKISKKSKFFEGFNKNDLLRLNLKRNKFRSLNEIYKLLRAGSSAW